MATEFQMPKLGLTMEAGTILSWLVPDGTIVAKGEAVLSIETDKVESDVEASFDGTLRQTAAVGETYECGRQIGWFVADGEAVPESGPYASHPSGPGRAPASTGRLLASPNAKRVAAELGLAIAGVAGTGPGGRITSEDVQAAANAATSRPAPAPSTVARVSQPGQAVGIALATAAGRGLAELLGIDVSTVAATGHDQRVTRDDVAAHVRTLLGSGPSVEPTSTAPAPALSQTPSSIVAPTGMRATIASRMHASLQEMAQLTLTIDVVMDAVIADRAERHSAGAAPGYTDYVIAAAARALAQHPIVNSQVTAEGVALLPDVHVGMAVALEGGLVVPVVRDASAMPLAALAAETTRLAKAARDGALKFTDAEGGTFSVTTLGAYGVDGFTPIINPPNTAILGIGRLRDHAVWGPDGAMRRGQVLTLSLTWDHRAFDGVPAAQFAATVRDLLEISTFD